MKLPRSSRLAALVAVGSLSLAACGGSDSPTPGAGTSGGAAAPATSGGGAPATLSGVISGAGASSQTAAMDAWIAGFQGANDGVTVNYDPVGSGAGREQFAAGDALAFAASDRALKPEEITATAKRCAAGGSVVDLPLYISPIAVAFNLDGVTKLNMKPATIAKVFNQKIKKWNDPLIKADNPDAQLPDLAITPVNRSDDSGTTENFTDYLSVTAKADWTYEADGVWPVKGGEAANGTSGVVAAIKAGKGSIGYADASQVGDLGKVAVGVGSQFVDYSPEAAAAVVSTSPRETGRMTGDIVIDLARDTKKAGEYPVVLVSYSLACTKYADAAQASNVKAFLSYVASKDGQDAAAKTAGSAPISAELRTEVEASIAAISG